MSRKYFLHHPVSLRARIIISEPAADIANENKTSFLLQQVSLTVVPLHRESFFLVLEQEGEKNSPAPDQDFASLCCEVRKSFATQSTVACCI
jgi:hypothetical protein